MDLKKVFGIDSLYVFIDAESQEELSKFYNSISIKTIKILQAFIIWDQGFTAKKMDEAIALQLTNAYAKNYGINIVFPSKPEEVYSWITPGVEENNVICFDLNLSSYKWVRELNARANKEHLNSLELEEYAMQIVYNFDLGSWLQSSIFGGLPAGYATGEMSGPSAHEIILPESNAEARNEIDRSVESMVMAMAPAGLTVFESESAVSESDGKVRELPQMMKVHHINTLSVLIDIPSHVQLFDFYNNIPTETVRTLEAFIESNESFGGEKKKQKKTKVALMLINACIKNNGLNTIDTSSLPGGNFSWGDDHLITETGDTYLNLEKALIKKRYCINKRAKKQPLSNSKRKECINEAFLINDINSWLDERIEEIKKARELDGIENEDINKLNRDIGELTQQSNELKQKEQALLEEINQLKKRKINQIDSGITFFESREKIPRISGSLVTQHDAFEYNQELFSYC